METLDIQEIESKIKSLSIDKYSVGYAFDERMLLHKNYSDSHYERPERAEIIYANLISKGLCDKLIRIKGESIDDKYLLDTHTPNHLENVRNLKYEEIKEIVKPNIGKKKDKEIETEKETEKTTLLYKVNKEKERPVTDNSFRLCYDTYDNYFTQFSAAVSAGTLLNCAKHLAENKVNNAFAIIRPPGHHANHSECRGFCFYNNVAVTTRYLIDNYNYKIAIVDWDVHHGDGTQEIFYGEKNPLFISIHRRDNGKFYPNVSGLITEQGDKDGLGYNINIPWDTRGLFTSKSGIGDDEYIYTFNKVIIPILNEYKPDFIIVSCGFDACENDPLGEMSLTPLGYSYMTNLLMEICPKILIALEGGYNLNSLQRSSEAIIRTLLKEKNPIKNLMVDKFELNAYVENKVIEFYKEISLNDIKENFFTEANYTKEIIKKVIEHNIPYWKRIQNNQIIIKTNLLRKNNEEALKELFDIINHLTTKDNFKIDSMYWKNLFEISNNDLFSLKNNKQNSLSNNENLNKNQSSLGCTEEDIKMNSFIRFNLGKVSIDKSYKEIYLNKYLRNTHKNLRTISRKYNFRLEGISSNKDLKDHRLNWNFTNGIFDVNENNLDNLILKFLNINKLDKNEILEQLKNLKVKCEWMCKSNIDLYNVDLIINFKKLVKNNEDNMVEFNKQEEKKKLNKFKVIKSTKKKYEISLKLNGIKKYSIFYKTEEKTKENRSLDNFNTGINSLISYLEELL